MQPSLLSSILLSCLFSLTFQGQIYAMPEKDSGPDQFIVEIADNILNVLEKDSIAELKDPFYVNNLVKKHIFPHFDFEKTTKLSVGPYWRQTTIQQREKLVSGFQGLLVHTYSAILPRIDKSIRLVLIPSIHESSDNDVVVKSKINLVGSQPIRVDYRIEKKERSWKIYDLNIEGVWLVESYRNQFAHHISQYGIDSLISLLDTYKQTEPKIK